MLLVLVLSGTLPCGLTHGVVISQTSGTLACDLTHDVVISQTSAKWYFAL